MGLVISWMESAQHKSRIGRLFKIGHARYAKPYPTIPKYLMEEHGLSSETLIWVQSTRLLPSGYQTEFSKCLFKGTVGSAEFRQFLASRAAMRQKKTR